jgi:hypothetical protein
LHQLVRGLLLQGHWLGIFGIHLTLTFSGPVES